jgi:hypothetical protein
MIDLIKKSRGSDKTDDKSDVLDGRTLVRLMHHFPIGTKVKYYPEYRKEILLDSVVIAYAINDKIVYSVSNLDCDAASGKIEFDDMAEHYVFPSITRFSIFLPIFTQSEAKLDYVRREELLKIGGLVEGNAISLIAEQDGGRVPVIETIVDKRTMLEHGVYANQAVAFLDVDTESLMLSDQRSHLRLNTEIPAILQITKKGVKHSVNGTMVDFSDRSLRFEIDDETSIRVRPAVKSSVMISFALPGHSEYASLVGDVFRVDGKAVVIMLTGMVEKGQVRRLGQIEILNIKANVLQHSNTKLAK